MVKWIAIPAAMRPVSAVTVWAAVAMLGAVAVTQLPLEMAPTLEIPQIRIVTELHGLPAAQVEKLVTLPVEESVSTVRGVRSIRSVSKRGLSSVALEFDWGVRVSDVAVQVRERIDAVYPLLPLGASKPAVFTERLDDVPLMVVSVRHEHSAATLKSLMETEILPALRRNADVGKVVTLGLPEHEIQVHADPHLLATTGLSVRDLGALVSASVYDGAVGTIQQSGYERPIRVTTSVSDTNALAMIPLHRGSGGSTLADVAEVVAAQRPPTSFFLHRDSRAAGLLIYRSTGSGAVGAARSIEATLETVSAGVGPSLTLEVVQDESEVARRALRGLLLSAALGGAAAVVVLLVLLRSWRSVEITLTSIPICVFTLFLVLHLAELSLNIMTLTGVTIGVGMIIDNSIVVLERLSRLDNASPARVGEATAEMTATTWSSTVTTILVFVPVLLVPGVLGALFAELAITLGTLLIVSFFCSATLTPALFLLRTRATSRGGLIGKSPRLPLRFERRYARLLLTALRHPSRTTALFSGAILLGGALLTTLPRSVLPPTPPRHVIVRLALPPAADTDATAAAAGLLIRGIAQLVPITSAYAYGGFERHSVEQQSRPGTGTHAAEVVLAVAPSVRHPITETERALSRFRKTADLPDGTRTEVMPRQSAMETLLAGPGGAARYRITLGSREAATALSRRLGLHVPQYQIRFDADAAAATGISVRDAIDHLSASVEGVTAGRISTRDRDFEIRVRASRDTVATAADLKRLPLPSGTGFVAAGTVLTPVWSTEPLELHRYNRRPTVEFSESSPAAVVPLSPAVHPQRNALAQLRRELPEAVVDQIGVSEMRTAGRDLLRVAALALILMLLLLTAQFESPAVAVLLMSVLPATLCGSVAALWITGHGLHLHSVLGMLVVLGTGINATIILTTMYRHTIHRHTMHRRTAHQHQVYQTMMPGQQRAGRWDAVRAHLSRRLGNGALLAVTRGRLLSILATTLTTAAALAPLALDPRPHNMAQSSMAVAVVGGLLSGTLFSLLVYPAAYGRSSGRGFGRRRNRS